MTDGFASTFIPGDPDKPVILALHGTGGDENSFCDLLQDILPGLGVLGIRGKVSENGANRYFARFAEGQLDFEDLAFRTQELADFLSNRSELEGRNVIALGYSNGANMASNLMLTHSFSLDGAILIRPMMLPTAVADLELKDTRILILAGEQDMLCPPSQAEDLARVFSRAGADIDLQILPAGHNLIRADVASIQQFFA